MSHRRHNHPSAPHSAPEPAPPYRAELVFTGFLQRVLKVTGAIDALINYDGTRKGFEVVLVDHHPAVLGCSLFRPTVLTPRLDFHLGEASGISATIQVRDPLPGTGGELAGFRLLIDGLTVYAEGSLAHTEDELPVPAAAPPRGGVAELPLPSAPKGAVR